MSSFTNLIPKWIEESEFVSQFRNDYPDDKLIMEKSKLFEFPEILTTTNICKVLENIRYFGITDMKIIDHIIYSFLYDGTVSFSKYYAELFPELYFIQDLQYYEDILSDDGNFERAVIEGRLTVLKICVHEGIGDIDNNIELSSLAAKHGHLGCLKFLYNNNNKQFNPKTCYYAAKNGHVKCLKFILDNISVDYDLSSSIRIAGLNGNLECLKLCSDFALKLDPECDLDVIEIIIKHSHIDCLLYIVEKSEINEYCFIEAGKQGNIEIIKILISYIDIVPTELYNNLIAYNHVECVKFLYSKYNDKSMLNSLIASSFGNLEILIFLDEIGITFNEDDTYATVSVEFRSLNEDEGMVFLEHRQLKCLKFLHENGCPWYESVTMSAMENDLDQCLDYAISNGCPKFIQTYNY